MTMDLEIARPDYPRGPFRVALFDFDGTLSLLRRGWQDVMVPMMVEELSALCSGESPQQLRDLVFEFVTRLTGKQTIYQMIQLAEEIRRRGGEPHDPLIYKRRYHDLLWRDVERRVDAVTSGQAAPESMMVAGAVELLTAFQQRGWTLYLASGTDVDYVRQELRVLGLERFFGPHVYGALDDYKKFSKAQVIQKLIEEAGVAGPEIVGVGDGYVEVEEIKRVGGLALGVASQEDEAPGVNAWKRQRLLQAGADIIVPHYAQCHDWLPRLQLLG